MDVLDENLRMRLAYLNATWSELAELAGERPANVRGWVARGSPRSDTLERLARILNVPVHALLSPEFNPREYDKPQGFEKEGQDEKDSD